MIIRLFSCPFTLFVCFFREVFLTKKAYINLRKYGFKSAHFVTLARFPTKEQWLDSRVGSDTSNKLD